jgi:hypothetical protein
LLKANSYRNTYGDILIDNGGLDYMRSSLGVDSKSISSLGNFLSHSSSLNIGYRNFSMSKTTNGFYRSATSTSQTPKVANKKVDEQKKKDERANAICKAAYSQILVWMISRNLDKKSAFRELYLQDQYNQPRGLTLKSFVKGMSKLGF